MKIPGLTFSWKRAIGITGAKQILARATDKILTLSARCVVTSAIVVG